jgi:3-deoxy-D-manno-octulosonic-acid transferase
MSKSNPFWFLLYNSIAIPVLYVGAQIARLFNSKIKRGIKERKGLFRRLVEIRRSLPEEKRIIVVHCASAGELEAARPVLKAIRRHFPDLWIHVTCYSPSGIKPLSKAGETDSYGYLPFDDPISAGRFFRILDPAAFLVVKHDIWPNMIWAASRKNIPCLWINANLHEKSRRLTWIGKGFNRSFLNRLSAVLTVGDAHALRLTSLVSPLKIEVVGDSRYDRAEERLKQGEEDAEEPLKADWFEGKKVIVAGSTWGPDQRILVPTYAALKKEYSDLFLILVPHEPHEDFLSETNYYLRGYHLKPIRFSQLNGELPASDVLVIDKVGILAKLYRYAWVAYVGGAFGEGVHSVLEPAVYGLPLFFGPRYYMANEAKDLIQRGGARSVGSSDQLKEAMRLYLEDAQAHHAAARASRRVVELGLGATDRIIGHLARHLKLSETS